MRTTITSFTALAAIALAIGCGDDDGMTTPTDGGMGDAMMPTDSGRPDSGRPDAGRDSGMVGDDNDSFDTADDIMVGAMEPAMGVISPAGDHDFYTFEGMAGQWIAIATNANPMDDPMMVDTVITLYDASMTKIAENDDSVPRVNTDSEIITRLPAAGTYYIEVQEFSDWVDMSPEGMASYTYELSVFAVDDAAPAVTIDTEAGDDVASAIPATPTAEGFGYLLGTFDDAADVDVFTLTIAGTAAKNATVHLMPTGPDGYGGGPPARAWIADTAGTTIIGRIDQGAMQSELAPSLMPGTYQIFVEHGTDAAGTNDFYVAKLFLFDDNPLEMEAAAGANDTTATAEALTLMMNGAGGNSGFLLAHLTDVADVDHFSFAATADIQITVVCGSAENGSGVMGLEVQLLAPDGTTAIATMTEGATGLLIDSATPMGAGTHYVRLSKTGQSAEVTGDWVRCGVHLNPLEP